MTGRKADIIWKFYEKKVVEGRKGCRAICKKCHKAMEGQIARMKAHYSNCVALETGDEIGK